MDTYTAASTPTGPPSGLVDLAAGIAACDARQADFIGQWATGTGPSFDQIRRINETRAALEQQLTRALAPHITADRVSEVPGGLQARRTWRLGEADFTATVTATADGLHCSLDTTGPIGTATLLESWTVPARPGFSFADELRAFTAEFATAARLVCTAARRPQPSRHQSRLTRPSRHRGRHTTRRLRRGAS